MLSFVSYIAQLLLGKAPSTAPLSPSRKKTTRKGLYRHLPKKPKKVHGALVAAQAKFRALQHAVLCVFWLASLALLASLLAAAFDHTLKHDANQAACGMYVFHTEEPTPSRASRRRRRKTNAEFDDPWLDGRKNKLIRVIIYARYSTDEQNKASIADQIEYCKQVLRDNGYTNVRIETDHDEAISGEVFSRPGIDRVKAGLQQRKWDLLIAEDASRLYRDETFGMQLVNLAVDQDVRVICINDDVDTEDENWKDELHEALREHRRANKFTRKRIKRAIKALWEMGAAVCILRSGYIRTPSVPAALGEPAKGPFFDAVDPQWLSVIIAIFEKVAMGAPPWAVAKFATEMKLPKTVNSLKSEWTEHNIKNMIRCTQYRGWDRHRVSEIRRMHTTGLKRAIDCDDIWERDMPHLRIVSDDLWYRANKAIDDRKTTDNHKKGADHPLYGIPRDSRSPLANVIDCGLCGEKMIVAAGRHESGYRCRASCFGECRNRATFLVDLAIRKLGAAIVPQILNSMQLVEAMINHIMDVCEDQSQYQRQIDDCDIAINSARAKSARLLKLASESDDPPPSLVATLAECDDLIKQLEAKKAELVESLKTQKPEVTKAKIIAAMEEFRDAFLGKTPFLNTALKTLIPNGIKAVPYQAVPYSADKQGRIVLRAEFELQLLNLVPYDLQLLLKGKSIELPQLHQPIQLTVDLFEESIPYQLAKTIMAKRYPEPGVEIPYSQLAAESGQSIMSQRRALQLAQLMQAQGLDEPYVRVTEIPDNVPRWKQ